MRTRTETKKFDLYVRGEIPPALRGSLITTASRRIKQRDIFSRWHDSQADLIRLDLEPGKPGKIRAHILSAECELPKGSPKTLPYNAQPNHGLNIYNETLWATNLLFGVPVEIDIPRWKLNRLLAPVEVSETASQVSSTSHFAWSPDRRYAFYHQSFLTQYEKSVRATGLSLVRLDCATGLEKRWKLLPPADDADMKQANFHSAFYYEEDGLKYIGLLRTGAVLETLAAHPDSSEHEVIAMSASTIWVVQIRDEVSELQANLLPGVQELGYMALSHLDVDASGGNGFILYANFKQADVAEETHGPNIYNELPSEVTEHYSGMTVEAINFGMVLRYEKRGPKNSIAVFKRGYDPGETSAGHSWLPINIQLDAERERLFCSFSGFRPRLLPNHIARAYPGLAIDPLRIRHVPSLLMRFDAESLVPQFDKARTYLSYTEPMAFCVAGSSMSEFVCTFSTETGLRIYRSDDLSCVICHAVSPHLMNWRDSHFRPDPAHLIFSQSR
jgi:hypothetical protein